MCIRDRLHMEIVRERLEREYRLDLVATAPSVAYRVHLTDHTVVEIRSPADLPDVGLIDHLDEPLIKALVVVPTESVSYTHLRAHETVLDLVCRLLLEKKKLENDQSCID